MRVTILLIVSIIIGLLSGCMLPREEELLPPDLLKPEEVEFRTIEVERGTIQDILEDYVVAGSSIHYDMTFHNRSGFLAELDVRTGQMVEAGDILARLDTDSLEIDIQRQQIMVEKLTLSLEEITRTSGSRFARRHAELDLEMAELLLTQLEDELEKSTIIAPVDGEIVFLSSYRIGEFVPGRSIILTIADPAHIQFEYSGNQVLRIRQGMEADIVVDSQSIKASVSMIPSNVPQEDRDRYRNTVIFTAKNPAGIPAGVRIGSRYSFSIFMEEKNDVIIIPSTATSNFLGQSFVQILEDGMRTERDIDIGIVTRTHVEVLAGLEEGEMLIVGIER